MPLLSIRVRVCHEDGPREGVGPTTCVLLADLYSSSSSLFSAFFLHPRNHQIEARGSSISIQVQDWSSGAIRCDTCAIIGKLASTCLKWMLFKLVLYFFSYQATRGWINAQATHDMMDLVCLFIFSRLVFNNQTSNYQGAPNGITKSKLVLEITRSDGRRIRGFGLLVFKLSILGQVSLTSVDTRVR